MNCDECMNDAPYKWCCKRECGKHEICRDCESKSRGYRSEDEPCS